MTVEREVSESVKLKHIAFIPDGNRRWARRNGLKLLVGHEVGFGKIKRITLDLIRRGVKYATFFCFSTENWNRSSDEVEHLMKLFRNFFHDSDGFFSENGVRVEVLGDLSKLPEDLRDKIAELKEKTKNNGRITLIGAVNYSGRDDIVRAVRKISKDVIDKKIEIENIDEDSFDSYLDFAGIPYPDVLVRTSEQRISNFLLWQIAYSELIFIDKLWPDIDETDIEYIVNEFSRRNRRYGK